ncbi:MAG: insulinase family protein [Prevotellaceae bacterium]|jgi:predicted Zn-dependent peptidase|nr:insulinase family protein [Prevotellaceae bacterium]
MKKIIIFLAIIAISFATANAQTLDRSIQPKPAPANEIKIKDAKTFVLDNGLKVFVVEDHKLPQVLYSFDFDIYDKTYGEKAGVIDIFSEVAGTGTTSKTKSELNKSFDLIGANFGFGSNGGYAKGLTKYRSKMIELFADVLLNPIFTDEEFDLAKAQAKSGLAYVSSDPAQMIEIVSNILMYGKNHPKGEMMTTATLDNITVADIEEYYKAFIAPDNTRLVVVGDITLAEAKAEVEKYFGKWEKHEVTKYNYDMPQSPDKLRVAFVNKKGAPQSQVKICYPLDYKPYSEDAFSVSIMKNILGGGASGRLFQNLRETHSYTYGCYNQLVADDIVGYYSAAAGVKGEVTDSAIYQILYEMQRIVDSAVTEKDVAASKAFYSGDFGRRLQHPETVAAFAVAIEKYNLPADYFKNYLKGIENVTIESVQAAAKKYIHPQNAWIVVVGDEKYAASLKQYAADGKIEFYDMYGNLTDGKSTADCDCTIYYLAAAAVVLLIVFIALRRAAAKRKKK